MKWNVIDFKVWVAKRFIGIKVPQDDDKEAYLLEQQSAVAFVQ